MQKMENEMKKDLWVAWGRQKVALERQSGARTNYCGELLWRVFEKVWFEDVNVWRKDVMVLRNGVALGR